jgi:hypothetical protein
MPTGTYQHKPLSVETKKKIGLANSIALKGRKLSDEHKRKVVLATIGRKHPPRTDVWREKQRKAKTGKIHGPCTKETKEKIRQAHLKSGNRPAIRKGSECHFWKGGISPKNELLRKQIKYKLWRKAVFKRDNYQCVLGGKEHGKDLESHHIKSFSKYPELRFVVENGQTLCKKCHRKTDTFGSKVNFYGNNK